MVDEDCMFLGNTPEPPPQILPFFLQETFNKVPPLAAVGNPHSMDISAARTRSTQEPCSGMIDAMNRHGGLACPQGTSSPLGEQMQRRETAGGP